MMVRCIHYGIVRPQYPVSNTGIDNSLIILSEPYMLGMHTFIYKFTNSGSFIPIKY